MVNISNGAFVQLLQIIDSPNLQ